MKLTNLQKLLIRACKEKQPHIRLLSVYKRFYYSNANVADIDYHYNMTIILGQIIDGLMPLTSSEISACIKPVAFDEEHASTLVFRMMVNKIRWANPDAFPEMNWPLKWKYIEGLKHLK